jgi:hypothetical protein
LSHHDGIISKTIYQKLTLSKPSKRKNTKTRLFDNDKKAVLELKEQMAKTDKEIDAMVSLYRLSEDEIGIVEGK